MDISGLLWEVPVAQKVGIMIASLLFAFHGCSSLVGFIHSFSTSKSEAVGFIQNREEFLHQ